MALFSKIKNARKAAEEHKKAASAQAAVETPAAPYKHVPTHAAADALAGASSTWSREERSQLISAAHKRRNDLKMISMSFAGSSGSFHSEIDHSKIAQVRRMNHNMSGSSLMLNVPGAGSSRASLNLPRPSTSTTHFHTNISDVAPPRASFSGYDSNFSAIAMARRQEQLSRSSLNETLKDAPPIPTVPARRQHVPSHASNASGSSHQTTHSSRTSFQQRPSPLSTSDPSPVESSNSSFSSENPSSSSSAIEMQVPTHSYPHAFQNPVAGPQAMSIPEESSNGPPHLSFPLKGRVATVSTVVRSDKAPAMTDSTTTSPKKSWFRRKK